MSVLRPMKAKSKDKARADADLAHIVRERDGTVCRLEKRIGGKWQECGSKDGTDTAHIIRRAHLSNAAAYHPDMCLRACRECHSRYDWHKDGVRVPLARARKAWKIAVALCKVAPPIRYNPDAR